MIMEVMKIEPSAAIILLMNKRPGMMGPDGSGFEGDSKINHYYTTICALDNCEITSCCWGGGYHF